MAANPYRSFVAGDRRLTQRLQGFGLFVAASALVLVPALVALDPVAGGMYAEWPRPLWLVAEFTTHLGEAHWILVPTGIVVLAALVRQVAPRNKLMCGWSNGARICAFFFTSCASAFLLSTLIKVLIGRARPHLMRNDGAFAWHPVSFEAPYMSFPSGHAASIGAACMATALLWPPLRWPVTCLALWLGFTRVFVGAHYPSDVAAGLLLGACVTLCVSAYASSRDLITLPPRAAPQP